MADGACPKAQEYRDLFLDLACEDTVAHDPALVDEARRHLQTCAQCRDELARHRRFLAALRLPKPPEQAVAEAAENLRSRVLAMVCAFERRRLVRRLATVGAGLAAAALLTLGLTLATGRVGGAKADLPRQATNAESPTPAPRPAAKLAPTGGSTSQPTTPQAGLANSSLAPSSHAEAQKSQPNERDRGRMLSRVSATMSEVGESLRKSPTPTAIQKAQDAIREARELIRIASGTPEARKARYYAFRYLQLLGEAEQAELEFEAYLGELNVAEGTAKACKMLEDEGLREERARNLTLAQKRFESMVASVHGEGQVAAVAHARLANVYACLQRNDLAVAERLKAIELGAPTAEARDCYRYLVRTSLCNREYRDALRYARALVALPGSRIEKANDEARLAMVVESAESPAKALVLYRRILEKSPDCATAKWRLKELEKDFEAAILKGQP